MLDVDTKESPPERIEHTKEQLRQEQEELRRIVDLIPQQIVVLNPEGQAIYANRVSMEYTGLSLKEVRADDFRDRVFHPEDIQRLCEQRQKALAGTIPFENEQRGLGKDGKCRWFLIRYNPFLNENGKVIRWYATATDIGSDPTLTPARCASDHHWSVNRVFDGIAGMTIFSSELCTLAAIDFTRSAAITTS
jgi:PAS domain S-box-containing protein